MMGVLISFDHFDLIADNLTVNLWNLLNGVGVFDYGVDSNDCINANNDIALTTQVKVLNIVNSTIKIDLLLHNQLYIEIIGI